MSPHALEVDVADIGHQVVHITHVLHKFNFCILLSIQLLELLDERLSHRDQGFLGPGKEPVDCAFIEQGREFSETVSELLADGREAKADVKVVSDPIHKVGVKLTRCRISSLELLDVVVSGIA